MVSFFNRALAGPLIAGTLAGGAWAGDMACRTDVAVSGTIEQVQARDFSAHVQLADVTPTPTMVGFGPGADLAFETTIADGKYALTRRDSDGIVVSDTPADGEGAVFLVRAEAGEWLELPPMPGVFDLNELSDMIGEVAQEHGCSGDMTFPFRIEAHAAELFWSVESKPERATGTLEDADVILMGIWSNHDKQDTFMVRGFNLHAHFVTADGALAGHVQDVSLDDGAVLFLPKSN